MAFHKYSAKKTIVGGISFASKLEAAVDKILQLQEMAGEIKIEQRQPTIYLTNARIIYKPDTMITNLSTGLVQYVEAKGFETPEWRIKRRLWMYYGPADLIVYMGSHARPFIKEVIVPKIE